MAPTRVPRAWSSPLGRALREVVTSFRPSSRLSNDVYFYMPITSQPRELDAKVLLALFAAERGMRPILGYKSMFRARMFSMPPGLFLAHNARQEPEKLRAMQHFGHTVLVLDEEALVRQSDEIFLKKHPHDAFDHVDFVYTWGQDDYDLWQKSGLVPMDHVVITGNPRVDTMRPELRPLHAEAVQRVRDRYGTYVLVNTNFPTVNNLTEAGGGVRLADWALDEHGRAIESSFLTNKRALFERFLEMVPELARAIAPTTLVLRPHPNEDHRPWLAATEGIDNVQVVFEGTVVPWLIGASALVHNNCTTGVEAAIMGVPTLAFRPWTSTWDNELSMAFGRECTTTEDLVAAVREVLAGRGSGMSAAQAQRLDTHISHLRGSFSCERIVEVAMNSFARTNELGPTGWRRLKLVLGLQALWFVRLMRLYVKASGRRRRRFLITHFPGVKPYRLNHEMLTYSVNQLDLLMRQFPPVSQVDLDARIAKMAEATGRFQGYRARILEDFMFTIEPPDADRISS